MYQRYGDGRRSGSIFKKPLVQWKFRHVELFYLTGAGVRGGIGVYRMVGTWSEVNMSCWEYRSQGNDPED